MQPISKVNPATDVKNPRRNDLSNDMSEDLTISSPEDTGKTENSALNRKPSEGYPDLGSDAEFSLDNRSPRESKEWRPEETVQTWADQAQETGKSVIEQTSSYLRQHPAPTLFGCFGVGLLTGFLIGRR